jgi:hypothetical protein
MLVAWPLVARLLVAPDGAMSPAAVEDHWFGIIVIGLSSTVVAIVLLSGWIRDGCVLRMLPAVGVIALLVDLLAAGGIGFPGVAGTLWLLVAIGLNAAEDLPPPRERKERTLPRVAAAAGLVLAIALAVTCYSSAYSPVLRSRGPMQAAQRKLAQGRPDEGEKYLEAAAVADHFAAEPWRHLADLTLQAWGHYHSDKEFDQAFKRLELYNGEAGRLATNSASTWAAVGESYQTVFRQPNPRWTADRRAEIIAKAVVAYERSVELYPNRPLYRARLALAYRDAGDEARFRKEARIALELDEITPHEDKKLGRLRSELADALGD